MGKRTKILETSVDRFINCANSIANCCRRCCCKPWRTKGKVHLRENNSEFPISTPAADGMTFNCSVRDGIKSKRGRLERTRASTKQKRPVTDGHLPLQLSSGTALIWFLRFANFAIAMANYQAQVKYVNLTS